MRSKPPPLLDAINIQGKTITADALLTQRKIADYLVSKRSAHYHVDWNFNEDRSRISKGHAPENITRLRRFAVSATKSKGARNVSQKMRQLGCNVRLVFDYL